MAKMAQQENNGDNADMDEILTQLSYAYEECNEKEIENWEAKYEKALDEMDYEIRTRTLGD